MEARLMTENSISPEDVSALLEGPEFYLRDASEPIARAYLALSERADALQEIVDAATTRTSLIGRTIAERDALSERVGVMGAALRALRQREVQMLGAAISNRNWQELESAYNQLRDKIDASLNQPSHT